jgi:hypothetical protein
LSGQVTAWRVLAGVVGGLPITPAPVRSIGHLHHAKWYRMIDDALRHRVMMHCSVILRPEIIHQLPQLTENIRSRIISLANWYTL